jgi:hypothetical protein
LPKFLGISRLEKNIIFESKVPSWLDCGMSCLDTQFCTGFNYNKNSKKNDINCQISHDSNHEFLKVSGEDNDWSFYQGNGDRMVRIIGKYSIDFRNYNSTPFEDFRYYVA